MVSGWVIAVLQTTGVVVLRVLCIVLLLFVSHCDDTCACTRVYARVVCVRMPSYLPTDQALSWQRLQWVPSALCAFSSSLV